MAAGEGSFNPLGYHVGTLWPHDTSVVAWGLWRYGYRKEAAQLAEGILEAAELFHHRLPEAFAGYAREVTKYPVEYPSDLRLERKRAALQKASCAIIIGGSDLKK